MTKTCKNCKWWVNPDQKYLYGACPELNKSINHDNSGGFDLMTYIDFGCIHFKEE